MKTYKVNEIFYSVQGEGVRAGTPNVFVRLSNCNLRCSRDGEAGFDCDTEFSSGIDLTRDEIVERVCSMLSEAGVTDGGSVILTGGEPALQVDQDLILALKNVRLFVAVESNGTIPLPVGLDWITISPKTAEHTLKQPVARGGAHKKVDELRYVRHAGQGIPVPSLEAVHLLLSPAFEADGSLSFRSLAHCIDLVKKNPAWRLSVQLHKLWGVR